MSSDDATKQCDLARGDPPRLRLGRGDFCIAAGVALAALLAYVWTLAPGLLRADSGEFQTLAVTLGYAHPTGYPVYLLLARLSTAIPVGDVPYRVNLLSAIMAAVAVAGVYLLGRLLTGRRGAALVGAVALAVSPTFWSQAIIAEAYTTGIAWTVGVLLALTRWQQTGRARWLFVAGCIGATSPGVQVTVVLMAPAVVLFLLLTPRGWKADWAAAVSGVVLGLLLLLGAFAVVALPDSPCCYFRTVIEPSRSLWELEPDVLHSFFGRIRLGFDAPQKWGLLFSNPPEVTLQKATWYGTNLLNEFPPLWLAASAVGLIWLGRRNWKMTLLLVVTYATHMIYDLHCDMGDIQVLYLATYVPIVLLAAAGLAALGDGCCDLAARIRRRWCSPAVSNVAMRNVVVCNMAVTLVGLSVIAWPMLRADAWNVEGRRVAWLPPEDQDAPFGVEYSTEFHAEVRQLIESLEPDAVVFTGWCFLYPYYYVAHVEMGCAQMRFFQDYPHPYHYELADSLVQYVKDVAADRPVYFTHRAGKVASLFELEEVRRGGETLYLVGKPLERRMESGPNDSSASGNSP